MFGYTAKQTLDYAQSLYEKKLLTYPRTDSRHLTSDMTETASGILHLAAKVPPFDGCADFFPDVEALISDQDVSDHHAIIPTMEMEKADVGALPVGERNLFLLVCCKMLCAAAEPHVYETVTAVFDCGGYSFTVKGKHVVSGGWREIGPYFPILPEGKARGWGQWRRSAGLQRGAGLRGCGGCGYGALHLTAEALHGGYAPVGHGERGPKRISRTRRSGKA